MFQKFGVFLLNNNLVTRLEVRYNTIQKALGEGGTAVGNQMWVAPGWKNNILPLSSHLLIESNGGHVDCHEFLLISIS